MTRIEKLSIIFDAVWDAFIETYDGLYGFEIQKLIERAELGEWFDVTEENVDTVSEGLEVGDKALGLNDDGKAILAIAKGLRKCLQNKK